MTKKVLLLGRTAAVVDEAREQLQMPDVELLAGTGLSDIRDTFAQSDVDHVIMGAGLDLEVRLEIVSEIFRSSETTTVHTCKATFPDRRDSFPSCGRCSGGLATTRRDGVAGESAAARPAVSAMLAHPRPSLWGISSLGQRATNAFAYRPSLPRSL